MICGLYVYNLLIKINRKNLELWNFYSLLTLLFLLSLLIFRHHKLSSKISSGVPVARSLMWGGPPSLWWRSGPPSTSFSIILMNLQRPQNTISATNLCPFVIENKTVIAYIQILQEVSVFIQYIIESSSILHSASPERSK